jgi:DHA2 family multidrug resistance protein-like MFS transporter
MVLAGRMSHARPGERMSIIAVLSAMALVVLDAGLVNVALPTIGDALKARPADAILAVSAYQTALVMGLLPCAQIAERWGCRRLFVGGLALFSVASITCACAVTLPMLVAARVVQGLGGAAIMSLGIALLRFALAPERLGKAIGWNALTVALCSAGGPVAGALILAVAPWPWLFLAKLPIIVIALAATKGLPEVPPSRHTMDAGNIALHGSAAALVLVAAGMAISRPLPAALLAAGAAVLAGALMMRQKQSEAPLWPVDLLALRPFRVSVIASICCFSGQSAGMLALSFHLQLGLGRGLVSAGLVMTCWPLTVAITSVFANRLAERFGSALPCVVGGLVLAAGLMLSALWPTENSIAPLVIGAALGGLGFGLFQVPNNRTLFLTAPVERSAAAGGMQGSARLIGQTIGALMIGLLLAGTPTMFAPRIGFALGSLFAVTAALVSAMEVPAISRFWRRTADAR